MTAATSHWHGADGFCTPSCPQHDQPITPPAPELPPAHHCRQDQIEVRAWSGITLARYYWWCDGGAIKVTSDQMPEGGFNGFQFPDWRGVVEDLMTYVVARRADRHTWSTAHGIGPDARYYSVSLTPVVRLNDLAGMVGARRDDLAEVLAGYALIRTD